MNGNNCGGEVLTNEPVIQVYQTKNESKEGMNERGNDIEQNEHTIKTKTSKKARLESKRDFLRRSKVIFKPIINQYLGKLKDGKEYWSIEFESQQEHEQNMEVNTESRMGKDKEVH